MYELCRLAIGHVLLLLSECLGGAKRDRTADLLRARQALSQLSYGPFFKTFTPRQLVGLGRFELPTSPLSGVRSNQLSYRPNCLVLPCYGQIDLALNSESQP